MGEMQKTTTDKRQLLICYLTGGVGQSIALFYLGGGTIAGIDAGGIRYIGNYQVGEGGCHDVTLEFTVAQGNSLITGLVNNEEDAKIPVHFSLPGDFTGGRVVRIDTPVGPVNARFELLLSLEK